MTNALEVLDVHKTYRTRNGEVVHALNGISFQVPQGRIYGLLGPNGAGKSTLVKILSTITPLSSGRASVLGFDVTQQPLAVREQLAVVLQHTATENLLTVRDNLLIYAYLHGIKPAVAQQRLNAIVDEFELGERLRDAVQELSLGTKRRIQVAKIFMLETPLIILDEATTGMDPLMKRRVMDRLRAEARNGRTILLTTQVLSGAHGRLQHVAECDLHPADVPQFDVLPAFRPTGLVSHTCVPQPDDVASRSVALQSSGRGLDYHIASGRRCGRSLRIDLSRICCARPQSRGLIVRQRTTKERLSGE